MNAEIEKTMNEKMRAAYYLRVLRKRWYVSLIFTIIFGGGLFGLYVVEALPQGPGDFDASVALLIVVVFFQSLGFAAFFYWRRYRQKSSREIVQMMRKFETKIMGRGVIAFLILICGEVTRQLFAVSWSWERVLDYLPGILGGFIGAVIALVSQFRKYKKHKEQEQK